MHETSDQSTPHNGENKASANSTDLLSDMSFSDIEEEPIYEPVNGIVQPPFVPPETKPHRNTTQLEFLSQKVLKAITKHRHAYPFKQPVDAIKFDIPEYHNVIKHPMDLGTIKKRLDNFWYYSARECIRDFKRMFKNCYTFNEPGEDIVIMAKTLEDLFNNLLKELPPDEEELPISPQKGTGGRGKKGRGRAATRKGSSIGESSASLDDSSEATASTAAVTEETTSGMGHFIPDDSAASQDTQPLEPSSPAKKTTSSTSEPLKEPPQPHSKESQDTVSSESNNDSFLQQNDTSRDETSNEVDEVTEKKNEEQSTDCSMEPQIKQSTEESIERPIETSINLPSEQLSGQSIEDPTIEPIKQFIEEPIKDPIEEPIEQPIEQPMEEPVEQPVEQPLEQPVEQPLKQPVEEPMEGPVGQQIGQPIDQLKSQPVEQQIEPTVVQQKVTLEKKSLLEHEEKTDQVSEPLPTENVSEQRQGLELGLKRKAPDEIEDASSSKVFSSTPDSESLSLQTDGDVNQAFPSTATEIPAENLPSRLDRSEGAKRAKTEGNLEDESRDQNANSQSTTSKPIRERKRRWGSSTGLGTATSSSSKQPIGISSNALKVLIPDLNQSHLQVSKQTDESSQEAKGTSSAPATVHTAPLTKNSQPLPDTAETEKLAAEKVENIDIDENSNTSERKAARVSRSISMTSGVKNENTEEWKSTSSKLVVTGKTNVEPTKDLEKENSPARNPPSNIVFVRNLVRPFTLLQLKELLKRTGKVIEDKFWIDKIKSKCYVYYETQEEAIATREALHGTRWPDANPKKLAVDFADEDELNFHLKGEEPPSRPVGESKDENIEESLKNTKSSDRIGSDKFETTIRHGKPGDSDKRTESTKASELTQGKEKGETERRPIREWDREKFEKRGQVENKNSSPNAKYRRDVSPDSSKRIEKDRNREKDHPRLKENREDDDTPLKNKALSEKETPAKLLDDLFKKTKAAPSIYWLPLDEEQAKKRAEFRERNAKKREEEFASREAERNTRMQARRRSPPPIRRDRSPPWRGRDRRWGSGRPYGGDYRRRSRSRSPFPSRRRRSPSRSPSRSRSRSRSRSKSRSRKNSRSRSLSRSRSRSRN